MSRWDDVYATDDLPWDTGVPSRHLAEVVDRLGLSPGRALEVGCGTGTNAVWLAARGFLVTAVDLSPRAVERARARAAAAGVEVDLRVHDVLDGPLPGGPYDLVFDRGVFHVFDEAAERATFARRVAEALAPEGRWISLAGSTEGPPRQHGPPRRSARDLVDAIEPWLEVRSIEDALFEGDRHEPARMWRGVFGRRAVAAQPSTRH